MIRPVAAVLVAVVCSAAAPEAAVAAYRAFRSPTGKLGCMFYSDAETAPGVRCDWHGGGDRAVTVGETRRGRKIHVTDTVLDPHAKILAYGKTTRFRDLRCMSRRSGISCRSVHSGHGFRVSVEKQEVF
jgi:hypothetical protein